MTDQEYDVLDELYFLTSFHELSNQVTISRENLKMVLKSLFEKGWVKCYKNKDEELPNQEVDLDTFFDQYNYLATKSGLFAHNSAN
jgi:hypothetical protein